jgi:hypothetical protein
LQNSRSKVINFFLYSACFLLLTTALAKLISSLGKSHILALPDPIFIIPFRWMFCIGGIVEMAVAYVCFFSKNIGLRAALVAVLSTNFVLYRLGLWLVGWHRPCPCLGSLTDALRISSQNADAIMKIILAYLLFGSYTILFWRWQQKSKDSVDIRARIKPRRFIVVWPCLGSVDYCGAHKTWMF